MQKMKTLLYTIEGETIKVIIEEVDETKYRLIVKGENEIVKYPSPSFIFSEPCFLDNANGHTLTEYSLIKEELKTPIKILNLSKMTNLTILNDFAGNQHFEQLHLPSSVKVIEKSRFLESVKVISNNIQVTHIGDNAFNTEYREVNEITFSDYNGSMFMAIGKNAFKNTKITLKINDGFAVMNRLTLIEESAFESSTGINSLEAKNLTYVPKRTFYNSDFTELTLSKAVNFEEDAFTNMNLETITLGNIETGSYVGPYKLKLENINNLLIYVPTEASRRYLIEQIERGNPMFIDAHGNSITSNNIIVGAWYNTAGHSADEVIEAINSGNYTGVIDRTFLINEGNAKVINNFINSTINEVDLTGNYLNNNVMNKIFKIRGAILKNFVDLDLNGSGKTLGLKYLNLEKATGTLNIRNITTLTALTLPTALTKTQHFNSLGIISLNLPSNIVELDVESFANNSKLETVNFSSSITKLPTRIFANCPKLSSLNVNNSNNLNNINLNNIDSIGTGFLLNNTAITSLTISTTVTEIMDNAFDSMGLSTLTFENFKFTNQILTNCQSLKNIHLVNVEGIGSVGGPIFDQKCLVYVDNYQEYENLIENTPLDPKPIYVYGRWCDSETDDLNLNYKVRDKNSKFFNHSFSNYTGDELYLINPSTLRDIDTLNLTKLTINNCASNDLLPISLKHLELKNCPGINISRLTNLTYLGCNTNCDISGLNKLKVLKCDDATVSGVITKPEELIVISSNATVEIEGLDWYNIPSNCFNTSYKNYNEIKNHTRFFDLERRVTHDLTFECLIIANILYKCPIDQSNTSLLNSLYILDSALYSTDFDLNHDVARVVYTHNITYPTVYDFQKSLSNSIKYFKLDLPYTFTPNWSDFNIVQRDVIILQETESLKQLLKNSEVDVLKCGVETLNLMDICAGEEVNLPNVKKMIWGVYSVNNLIKLNAPQLTEFDYSWEDKTETDNPILDTSKTIVAQFEEFNAPNLTVFKYSEVPTTWNRGKFIIDCSNLKKASVNFNILDYFKPIEHLKTIHFGPNVDNFNSSFSGCNELTEIYLECQNITFKQSIVSNPEDVKVYVYDETVFDALYSDPDAFIKNIPKENIILFNIVFKTSEHTIEELKTVFETGTVAGINYTEIDDDDSKLYEISQSALSQNIISLVIYKQDDLKTLMNRLTLTYVKRIKFVGEDIEIYHIGEGTSGENSTRAANILNLDLSEATLKDNSINDYACNNCLNLKQITFNESVETIGEYAFNGCPVESYLVTEINDETTYFAGFANSLTRGFVDNFVKSFSNSFAKSFVNSSKTSATNILTKNSSSKTSPKSTHQELIKNFKQPAFETYRIFDDSTGMIEQLGLDLNDISPQYNELRIYLTQMLNKTIPKTIKNLTILGSIDVLQNESLKNISILNINTIKPITIKEHTFENSNITSISGNIGRIEKCAFKNSKLSKIDANCEYIDESAFEGCEISFVDLPKVNYLGENAFKNCHKLTNVVLGSAEITNAFNGCDSIEIIKSDTETIHKQVFKNSNIKTVICPKVKLIDDEAFYHSKLEKIECPNVEMLGEFCFNSCRLNSIDILKCEIIKKYCFENTNLVYINANPKIIGNSAFKNCAISSINLENAVEIHARAFENCKNLQNETMILDNLIKIEDEAFAGTNCRCFKSNAIKVGANILKDCPIYEIRLPNYKQEIVFDNQLETLELSDLKNALDTKLKKLIIHSDKIENLKQLIQNVQCEEFYADNLLNLEDYMFMNSGIKVVSLKKCLKIGKFAFCGSSLNEIYLENCACIDESAFKNCVMLKNATFKHVKNVNDSAFEGCENLLNYEFDENCNIGNYVFKNCVMLKNVKISGDVKNNVYEGCKNLNSELILNNTTKIGDYAFANSSITKITLCKKVSISKFAFSKSQLKEIVGSEFITSIGENCFAYSQLTKFINFKITTIPKNAFLQCNKLEELNLLNCVTNKCSFFTCTKLKNLHVLDFDLISGISFYDDCKFELYVLRDFKVPAAISSYSTFKGRVYCNSTAKGLSTAKVIMKKSVF